MFGVSFNVPIYLCITPTDMRKNFDGLTAIVTNDLQYNATKDGVFVFVNKLRDRMKIVFWDCHGFVL